MFCVLQDAWWSQGIDILLYWPAWVCVFLLESIWLFVTFLLPVPGCPKWVNCVFASNLLGLRYQHWWNYSKQRVSGPGWNRGHGTVPQLHRRSGWFHWQMAARGKTHLPESFFTGISPPTTTYADVCSPLIFLNTDVSFKLGFCLNTQSECTLMYKCSHSHTSYYRSSSGESTSLLKETGRRLSSSGRLLQWRHWGVS